MSDLSPFLNTGVIFAVFQSRGSLPSTMNYFKSIHSEGASSSAHSFIIIGGELSGPCDLVGFRFWSAEDILLR